MHSTLLLSQTARIHLHFSWKIGPFSESLLPLRYIRWSRPHQGSFHVFPRLIYELWSSLASAGSETLHFLSRAFAMKPGALGLQASTSGTRRHQPYLKSTEGIFLFYRRLRHGHPSRPWRRKDFSAFRPKRVHVRWGAHLHTFTFHRSAERWKKAGSFPPAERLNLIGSAL